MFTVFYHIGGKTMSKIPKYAGLIIVLAVALALAAGTVLARSPSRPYYYTSYMAKCGELPPEEVTVNGDVMRLKGVVTYGRVFGDPYFAGEFENRFDLKLNTATGTGWVRGTTVITPDTYDGAWEGHFAGRLRSFVFSGRGIDFGKGDLEGLVEIVRIEEISPDELPAEWSDPCEGEPVLGANLAHGRIIEKKLTAVD
jgi:hypothetical protein